MEAFTALVQSQLETPPASQTQTDDVPRSKVDATPIDDEDLFLGDDTSDEIENDIPGEEQAEDDEEDDEEDDDDIAEDYFASTYRPLSNLPTPPPSSQSSLIQSPSTEDDTLESSLLGPAVHLVNMLPSACSIVTPSVPLVQAMLTRAQLPINTIALAVCILDSLDSRFARTWRLTCPLAHQAPSTTAGKRHTLPSPLTPDFSPFSQLNHDAAPSAEHRLLHIDAVFPEVIILAALVIAAKFNDDGHATQQPAQAYCTAWSSGASLWTGAQLAATERCIMQSLNYRIMPLLDDELLADACADMRRAGVQALRSQKMRAATAAAAQKTQPKASDAQAMMTPPEEVVVAACREPSHSPCSSSSVAPSFSAAPTGLGLELPPSATQDATLTSHPSPLSSMKRRNHMPSHSECLGRFTYDH